MPKLIPRLLPLLIIVILLLTPTSEVATCHFLCTSCTTSSPFTCRACTNDTMPSLSLYLWSCQKISVLNVMFLPLAAIIICLHLFMLAMGFGVYSPIFGYLQLTGLLMWVNLGDWGTAALQITCFGVMRQNSFVNTYGIQTLLFVISLSVFFLILVSTTQTPHNPTSILLRRKKLIFPLRLVSLIFNMLLFSSLTSISKIPSISSVDFLELFVTIMGLLFVITAYLTLFYFCNFHTIQLDDPNFYPICQKMISSRWWVRNNMFFQYTCSMVLIIVFVLGFEQPALAIIPILLVEALYCVYFMMFLSFTKLRYKIVLATANFVFFAILFTLSGLTSYWNDEGLFYRYQAAYLGLVVLLSLLFIVSNIVEIVADRFRIGRLLRSIKNRFILCEKLEKQVQLNKYDSNGRKERVMEFQDNQLYGSDLSELREKLGITST